MPICIDDMTYHYIRYFFGGLITDDHCCCVFHIFPDTFENLPEIRNSSWPYFSGVLYR